MPNTYPILPLPLPEHPDPKHPIPLRRELTELIQDPNASIQLSLYVQALQIFMAIDDLEDELSYFRIAAIHGAPYVGWDGVNSPNNGSDPGKRPSNFCAHNLVTFPTWHRPYMLLFEGRLYAIMQQVIDKVPEKERPVWQLERERWRLPYWNWARLQPYCKSYGVPEFVTQEFIPSIKSQGDVEPLNPLWKFVNPIKDEAGNPIAMGDKRMGKNGEFAIPEYGPFKWSACKATSRHANTAKTGFINGDNQWNLVNKEFSNPDWYGEVKGSGSIAEAVYRLFCYNYSSYGAFASTSFHESMWGSNYLSLEYIHNNIHNFTGGQTAAQAGQMSDVAVAAFDPIFWLHHGFIDELLAIWQSIPRNRKRWFNRALPHDPPSNAALEPFHKDRTGGSYTSDNVRWWTGLGYQYRYLPSLSSNNVDAAEDAEQMTELIKSINSQYGLTRRHVLGAPHLKGFDNDYIVNVVYDRYALDQSYVIYFFLAPIPDDHPVESFSTHKDLVGSIATFSPNGLQSNPANSQQCTNCATQKAEKVLSRAQIHLTSALLHRAQDASISSFNSLVRDDVEGYLAQRLSWRVAQVDGTPVPSEQLSELHVMVMQGKAEHFEDEGVLSKYYGYTPMARPTEGKAGGATEESQVGMWAPEEQY